MRVIHAIGWLAQLVEQLAYNEKVSGSSPLLPSLWNTLYSGCALEC
jgi:hypothetical protein